MPNSAAGSSNFGQSSRCGATSRSAGRRWAGLQRRQFFCDQGSKGADFNRGRPREDAAPEHIVLSLLPLVRQIAAQMRRHLPAQVELSDLIQEGVVGLMDAVRKFDGSRRVKIDGYARHRIRGAILDSLRRSDHASRDVRRKAHLAARASAKLEAQLGRPATSFEMARALGMSLEDWYRTARDIQVGSGSGETSLDQAEQDRPPLAASLPADESENPFEACYRREQREILARALGCLTERDRAILHLYYQSSLTMKEIGERLGIDESRVSQLHSRAVGRLGECVRSLLARPTPAHAARGAEPN